MIPWDLSSSRFRFRNKLYPRCPLPLTEEQEAALPHHHRVMRRSISKLPSFRFESRLRLPYLYWVKVYGNKKIGASMAIKAENEVDIYVCELYATWNRSTYIMLPSSKLLLGSMIACWNLLGFWISPQLWRRGTFDWPSMISRTSWFTLA